MSVDVFGRNLKISGGGGSQGPPGIGFKITSDGQYDLQDKRLCNVAAPAELNEAVNLSTLQRILRVEIERVTDLISRLRSDHNNLSTYMETYKDETDQVITDFNDNFIKIKEVLQDIVPRVEQMQIPIEKSI